MLTKKGPSCGVRLGSFSFMALILSTKDASRIIQAEEIKSPPSKLSGKLQNCPKMVILLSMVW